MKAPAAFFLAFVAAASARAQTTITTVPAHPVAGAPFLVHVVTTPCFQSGTATVNGSNIDILLTPFANQISLCEAPVDIPVGALPAGTYTVRLFTQSLPIPFATQALQVTADVPALDPRVLSLLALALIVLAMFRLAR